MQVWGMRNGISIVVSRSDRRRLQMLVADRNALQKHVWRAEIVLLTADGFGTNEIMRRTAKSKTCVWRWQERFAEEGFKGLLRDKTRPSRVKALEPEVAKRVVALTLTDPPGRSDTLDWRDDGEGGGDQRQFGAAHLAPSRSSAASGSAIQALERSAIRRQAARRVGLYVDPPTHAIVLSMDEKSQILALDRTQPGLPLKNGRAGTMTHDHKRRGTTTPPSVEKWRRQAPPRYAAFPIPAVTNFGR